MNRIVILLSLLLIVLVSCQEEDNDILLSETGTVIDLAGVGNCGVVIELDNGSRIQPLYYPKDFTFTHGQRVLIEYTKLSNVINGCKQGAACEISYAEELSCAPYTDLYFETYDSLANDPVSLREVYVDGNCLYLKISYSGGCQQHTVDLARIHPKEKSDTTIPVFEIRHNSNDDLCKALFTKEFRFDLSTLKQEGKNEFTVKAKLSNGEVYLKKFEFN